MNTARGLNIPIACFCNVVHCPSKYETRFDIHVGVERDIFSYMEFLKDNKQASPRIENLVEECRFDISEC